MRVLMPIFHFSFANHCNYNNVNNYFEKQKTEIVQVIERKKISKEQRIQIFHETLAHIEGRGLPEIAIAVVEGSENISPYHGSPTTLSRVQVEGLSSFQMAQRLVQDGYSPLVLDMANSTSPGGSVLDGEGSQEEALCMGSNLYKGRIDAKRAGLYPIPEYGGILVRNVTFFRDDDFEFINNPFQVDIFASAAYDCNKSHKPNVEKNLVGFNRPDLDTDYERGTKAKMRACFRAAKENFNDALVLGAFGCGAFKNNPEQIVLWYKEVLSENEFLEAFKLVTFAIIPPDTSIFRTFDRCCSI